MTWEQKIVRITVIALCLAGCSTALYGGFVLFDRVQMRMNNQMFLRVSVDSVENIIKTLEPYERGR